MPSARAASPDWQAVLVGLRRERELLEEGRWEEALPLAELRADAEGSLAAASAPEGVRRAIATEIERCLVAAEALRREALEALGGLARYREELRARPADPAYLDRLA
jgi:hypothetical protein